MSAHQPPLPRTDRPPRIVRVMGQTYQVHQFRGGFFKAFRVDVVLVEDEREIAQVRAQMLYEDEPVTPDGGRRVPPHTSGGGLP